MKATKQESNPYDLVLFSTVVMVFYFLFQIVLINFSVTASGECFYQLFKPRLGYLDSPFWLILSIVCLLLVWLVTMFVSRVITQEYRRIELLFYATGLVFLGFWLRGLGGMWDTMLFEYGVLAPEQFFFSQSVGHGFEGHESTLEAYEYKQRWSPSHCK